MSLRVQSSEIYARAYTVTRGAQSLVITLDRRAVWRGIPDSGTYSIFRQGEAAPLQTGPWSLPVNDASVQTFFEDLINKATGTTVTLTPTGMVNYAIEHRAVYNESTATEGTYLIRLDTRANRRLIFEVPSGAEVDQGRWRVNALQGPQVTAFFERMIFASTGVAPV